MESSNMMSGKVQNVLSPSAVPEYAFVLDGKNLSNGHCDRTRVPP